MRQRNGQSKICQRQPLKTLKEYGLLKAAIILQVFRGSLPQILLGPFLNTLFHIFLLPGIYI